MVTEISGEELHKMRESGKSFRLVNVLGRGQFERERIPGSESIPLEDLGRDAPGRLDKDELIIVYSASFACQASTRAAEILERMGYRNVLDYAGGLKDYRENGGALEGSGMPQHL